MNNSKAISLSQRMDSIYRAISDSASQSQTMPSTYCKIIEVFDTHVIVECDEIYQQVDYTIDSDGTVTLAPRADWITVDKTWTAKSFAFEKAVWTVAFQNDLPDKAFLYIDNTAKGKDDTGRTTPRSARHFPVLNANGAVDLPHLRNALARIPQSNAPGLTAEKKQQLQTKARAMLKKAQSSKTALPFKNALKAVSSNDNELRVANYMVLFGGRDLEGIVSPKVNEDGSLGEYFTRRTKFVSPYTDTGMLYVDWEHGLAPKDEPGRNDVLGYVDWKSASIDERGVFVERVLNRHNRYVGYLEELIDAGIIGNSSEAIPDNVEIGMDGEIKTWPLRRDTLTVTPLEPRMKNKNVLTALNALSEHLPALKAYIPAEFSTPGALSPETDSTSVVRSAECQKTAAEIRLRLDLLELEQ